MISKVIFNFKFICKKNLLNKISQLNAKNHKNWDNKIYYLIYYPNIYDYKTDLITSTVASATKITTAAVTPRNSPKALPAFLAKDTSPPFVWINSKFVSSFMTLKLFCVFNP